MLIGVDAKWFIKGPPGGHTYVQNILRSLLKQDGSNNYILYCRRDDAAEDFRIASERYRKKILSPNISFLRVRYALARAALKDNLDILFTQSLAPKVKGIPKVVAIYDLLYKDFPQYFTWLEKKYFRFVDAAIREADAIVTISEYSKERICHWFSADSKKIFITPCAADSRFHPINGSPQLGALKIKYKLPQEFLLYIGRLNVRKNLPRVFQALKQSSCDLPLVCVGKKDWKSDPLDKIIRDMGMKKRILFTGYVLDEELPLFMNLAAAFIYMPFGEGFGIPPLEALACGTPVVASRATALPEVLGDAAL
ncbi:MAG TPA: glycosyltransferase family 1 protein, partial [Candidatus Sumerlaeia bacterium]|nr:glycosyltransferase family 1 protein [Candidatus Sumerlaeia bacterium]